MAAWLISALALARGLVPRAAPALRRAALPAAAAAGGTIAGGLLLPGGGDGMDGVRRRRRKRVLTQTDKNDIAFIAATLGEATGRKFALIIAARMA